MWVSFRVFSQLFWLLQADILNETGIFGTLAWKMKPEAEWD